MSKKTDLPPVPASLADVALVDAPSIAAAAQLSLSAWHALVHDTDAPQPVVRQPRYTRWRLADIRAWLIERAEAGSDPKAAAAVVENATKASAKARSKSGATTKPRDR
ncbi:MAG: hypothetical protein LKCHEGNO_01620 [Burkholderiaceae bacterium]|nr:hypothetical protein [Burkholderiaceae bacterium]